MITDRLPRSQAFLNAYRKSDRMTNIALPEDGRLIALAKDIEEAMLSEQRTVVSRACHEFLATAAEFYGVPKPAVRVLASRPLRVYESGWSTELFGDYELGKNVTRVWMRTAVRKQVTSFGTFLSTLCHEFCHQLDSSCSTFASPRTRAAFMSGRHSCTTMRAAHPRRASSGVGCRVTVFGLIGHA
jgi:hypothetical protein